jgi:hypothetical protein
MLIPPIVDTEKTAAIQRFSTFDTFVFLISIRAGNEGLNLRAADTAIIFDPDRNPQNDFQAQARLRRIGETQKVDIFRLVTFQTYEQKLFVRAQRKLELWLVLLGSQMPRPPEQPACDLRPPPEMQIVNDDAMSLTGLLDTISTVVPNVSIDSLPMLEKPLQMVIAYDNGMTDDQFHQNIPRQKGNARHAAGEAESVSPVLDRRRGRPESV